MTNATDDVDPALRRGRALPLLGVLLGGAVLATMPLIVPRVAPALPVMTLVGAGAAAGFVFWLLALLTGLRRGPGWWIAASLALLVAGGALAGYNAARIGHADGAADASTFAEVKLNPDATPILPSNPARGPVSTAYVEMVRADERDAKLQGERVAKLNPGVLNTPYTLTQAPGILRDCGAIDALGAAASDASARRQAREAALARQIASAQLDAAIRDGIAEMAALPDGAAQALLDHERAGWAATRELCELLAKRSWSNANGLFGFASRADKAAFDALNQRRVAIETERKQVRDRIKARFEAGRDKVRAALS
jgi:hypothetical protein